MVTQPSKKLEIFKNPYPGRSYTINIECPEFTCLCPKTGQPDFAEIRIRYIPDEFCVELKSLKLYLWSYRNEGAFHEAVTNRILDDLVKAVKPRQMVIDADFNVRGGIHTVITADYSKPRKKIIDPGGFSCQNAKELLHFRAVRSRLSGRNSRRGTRPRISSLWTLG